MKVSSTAITSAFMTIGAALAVVLAAAPAHAESPAEAARAAYDVASASYPAGQASAEDVYRWSKRVLIATFTAAKGKKAQGAALAEHLERMRALENTVKKGFAMGTATQLDARAARFFVLEAKAFATRGRPD